MLEQDTNASGTEEICAGHVDGDLFGPAADGGEDIHFELISAFAIDSAGYHEFATVAVFDRLDGHKNWR